MQPIFGTQSSVIVPEAWRSWADRCRDQAAASRKYFTLVLALMDDSAARWIEDEVPDSWRAQRVGVGSDDEARAAIVGWLNSSAFSMADKRAMVSAWLCRDITGAADAESNPHLPLAVRLLVKEGREGRLQRPEPEAQDVELSGELTSHADVPNATDHPVEYANKCGLCIRASNVRA
jgi:hypothetical protein